MTYSDALTYAVWLSVIFGLAIFFLLHELVAWGFRELIDHLAARHVSRKAHR